MSRQPLAHQTRACTYLVDLDTDEPCGRRAVITVSDPGKGAKYHLCRRHERGGRRRAEQDGLPVEVLPDE
jgi:hypothetical protein